jgi:hypothetical protein
MVNSPHVVNKHQNTLFKEMLFQQGPLVCADMEITDFFGDMDMGRHVKPIKTQKNLTSLFSPTTASLPIAGQARRRPVCQPSMTAPSSLPLPYRLSAFLGATTVLVPDCRM